MEFININYDHWDATKDAYGVGCVVISLVGIPKSEEEVKSIFDEWLKVFKRSEVESIRHALILDSTKLQSIDFGLFTTITSWVREQYESVERHIHKTSIIITNDTIAGMVNMAIGTLYSPVRPCKVFSDLEEGIKWSLESSVIQNS